MVVVCCKQNICQSGILRGALGYLKGPPYKLRRHEKELSKMRYLPKYSFITTVVLGGYSSVRSIQTRRLGYESSRPHAVSHPPK